MFSWWVSMWTGDRDTWLSERPGKCYSTSSTFYPLTPNRLFYQNSLDRSISNRIGVWLVSFFYYYHVLQVFAVFNGTMVMRRLIWVYTVYQWPFYWTLGINGLNSYQLCYILSYIYIYILFFFHYSVSVVLNLAVSCLSLFFHSYIFISILTSHPIP